MEKTKRAKKRAQRRKQIAAHKNRHQGAIKPFFGLDTGDVMPLVDMLLNRSGAAKITLTDGSSMQW